ncbi:hypothetical protein [Bacillus gobiensis]|uniref:Uncharacterized protein n=1 Tax=Bacillus gobiensis TaxID=1441095 RepID=A0A0M5JBL0_9BACI|nr:hypothetical protein [Bacillus gobiensis]ALC81544.1 hypothetical protein AM592_07985 [Bacillus gobiensis]
MALYDKYFYAREGFSGSGNFEKTFKKRCEYLVLINTGVSDLTVEVNGHVFMIPSGYTLDELLEPFDSISVTATDTFCGYVRDEVIRQ